MEKDGIEFQNVREAAAFIQSRMPFIPRVGIILGTGWGLWMETLDIMSSLDTAEVPHMMTPGVASHSGRLTFAMIREVPVAIFAGRVHYYEGYAMDEVVRAVRILHAVGCTHLVLTNAAGGLNADYEAGDIVLIRDHINLMNAHPLRGPNESRWGPRFPDMMQAYDRDWIQYLLDSEKGREKRLRTGVYAGVSGPSLETPAEYEYLHRIGADLVGMSAVPEVIAARHLGITVLAVSVVSNVCYPLERIRETTVEDVISTVSVSVPQAGAIVEEGLKYLSV